jgi:hypothetical protein
MKEFTKAVGFFLLPGLFVLVVGLILPTTPKASQSLLMSAVDKENLLRNVPSPRIIFIGGSNASFGLNSETIRDSLRINPINTGIHVAIGLKYMCENALDHVRKGDIVILIPEYHLFYESLNSGSEELMRSILDTNQGGINPLDLAQIVNITAHIPRYTLSKFNPRDYILFSKNELYSVDSFNQFGDANAHWDMEPREFQSFTSLPGRFNPETIPFIEGFSRSVKDKGAQLVVTFPCLEGHSFDNLYLKISEVEEALQNSSITVVGSASRYRMSRRYFFDTPYHLNKKGIDHRTDLIIEDIRKVLN